MAARLVGKTGETVANWNNSRPWIRLYHFFSEKTSLKKTWSSRGGKSVVVALTPFHLFLSDVTVYSDGYLECPWFKMAAPI